MSFIPIRLEAYIVHDVRANPGANPRELRERLNETLAAFRQGARCACGAPIWVVGSAEAGLACFTCITGEAAPAEDFELENACDK